MAACVIFCASRALLFRALVSAAFAALSALFAGPDIRRLSEISLSLEDRFER
ncbi:hypothetical protein NEOLEDRAFT_1143856 [Neolentinus lepideus HHB14362 ss-1]|uniref:Uncharacterized protein n=1 Tax=Neolentinus lepideus HHB14362 ss-1 TaxID=1314782 RepID=A0A165MAD0_9AGAM|nr:hypothetical protein NEOLEDRAFT_1143856 [Neolentinus lepideus HHB14362 ss-1]